ncbi:YbaK/aminoacyl-tRNA synthetase-associated domain [Dillenia turbinata]|uniref:YbaK/aminoacyl-tRNA synthetase-associated domain n=1 Tax=Dillenia turbinata TaxID=194707 RepID=A0AAN8W4L6_9MAGN
MGFSKEQLLARLKELQIPFVTYEHPVVMTVDAQDKKNRLYIISALADTRVDLKVLSTRLGLGKGGLRMAPEETLQEILQVPLGCVTPFSVINESARLVLISRHSASSSRVEDTEQSHISLLLDQGFRAQDCCFFHPLSNDMTICKRKRMVVRLSGFDFLKEISTALKSQDLDKFLRSIGKESPYVDLEANPPVGKDQPPDLASFVPSGSTVLPDPPETASSNLPSSTNHTSLDDKSPVVTAKVAKTSSNSQKVDGKPSKAVNPSVSSFSSGQLLDEIVDKAATLVLSEITKDTINQHGEQLGLVVSNSIRKYLGSELKYLAVIYKNTAYTEGFHAGIHYQPKRL